jgi:hypothetical protein
MSFPENFISMQNLLTIRTFQRDQTLFSIFYYYYCASGQVFLIDLHGSQEQPKGYHYQAMTGFPEKAKGNDGTLQKKTKTKG